jgi:DNA invertase Pin-like site-specific DNA recombinase
MKTYGYARVSAKDQCEDRQLRTLKDYGIPDCDIFADKRSGKNFDRPAWLRLMERVVSGDLLVIPSIDRLGRNYEEIISWWRRITKEIRADILILDMPLLDTRQGRDLTGMLIADIVLGLLSYVAQRERECIRERQAEGIAAAIARGVRFGRREKVKPDNFDELCRRWRAGEFLADELAARCGVCRTTLFKWLRVQKGTL